MGDAGAFFSEFLAIAVIPRYCLLLVGVGSRCGHPSGRVADTYYVPRPTSGTRLAAPGGFTRLAGWLAQQSGRGPAASHTQPYPAIPSQPYLQLYLFYRCRDDHQPLEHTSNPYLHLPSDLILTYPHFFFSPALRIYHRIAL